MRIGLNVTCLDERPSGAGRRFKEIYGTLFQLMHADEFILFEPENYSVASWFPDQANVVGRTTPMRAGDRLYNFRKGWKYWDMVFRKEKFDIFESFNLPAVGPSDAVKFLTIHDIRYLYTRKYSVERMLFILALKQAVKLKFQIITVSYAMKLEIEKYFPSADVSVIYNSFSIEFLKLLASCESMGQVCFRDRERKKILTVGHLEKRKNYLVLVEAIAILKRKGIDVELIIIGKDGGEAARINEFVRDIGLDEQVKIVQNASDHDLASAYYECDVFAFISHYEGFGIPVLEAIAAGKPLVLSNLAVFREIAAECAMYCDQRNPNSVAACLARALQMSQSPVLDSQEKGKILARFAPTRNARSLAQLYQLAWNGDLH